MFRLLRRTEDLTLEEVDYELRIRQQPEEIFSEDLSGKQRLLRNLFRSDVTESRNHRSTINIKDEAPFIEDQIENLRKALSRKVEPKLDSRVLHYWYRVRRSLATNDEEKKVRRELSRTIEVLMKYYNFGPPLSPFKEHINTALHEADRVDLIDLNGQGAAGNVGSRNIDPQKSVESEKLPTDNRHSIDHPNTSKGAVRKLNVTVP